LAALLPRVARWARLAGGSPKAGETDLALSERLFRSGGTEGSNPPSSSGESCANCLPGCARGESGANRTFRRRIFSRPVSIGFWRRMAQAA
jgi:hypothetical protein